MNLSNLAFLKKINLKLHRTAESDKFCRMCKQTFGSSVLHKIEILFCFEKKEVM